MYKCHTAIPILGTRYFAVSLYFSQGYNSQGYNLDVASWMTNFFLRTQNPNQTFYIKKQKKHFTSKIKKTLQKASSIFSNCIQLIKLLTMMPKISPGIFILCYSFMAYFYTTGTHWKHIKSLVTSTDVKLWKETADNIKFDTTELTI